ncbi:MAG: hypothetical protein KY445_00155 [Armatimonadetes bacterium]|nr:hypothetical protein [Armatimonadota bacterium]
MERYSGTCPLTRRQIADEYFIESRNRLLEIAAFLDRLERAAEGGSERDFRVQAFQEALQLLCDGEEARVQRVQMLLSDPSTQLKAQLDQKSATGAHDHWRGEEL